MDTGGKTMVTIVTESVTIMMMLDENSQWIKVFVQSFVYSILKQLVLRNKNASGKFVKCIRHWYTA